MLGGEDLIDQFAITVGLDIVDVKRKFAVLAGDAILSGDPAAQGKGGSLVDVINTDGRCCYQTLQFEVGVGMQFFFPYFILSPEIKFSQGLNNTLIYNRSLIESRIIEKLTSRTFTISFHIEG